MTALLIVEVSASSLQHDRNVKGPIYARAGIPEYWIVDIAGRAVEVHKDPDQVSATYRSIVRVVDGGTVSAEFAPLPPLRVADFLP
jgi:Uma2 family endonuclease